jgi:lipopolysaccharide export system permease protein
VSQGKVTVFMAAWPIHTLAFGIAFLLIRNRINPSLAWWRRQLPSFLSSK